MHPLDFISQSPQTFIFQKETNKTNLGGILFLVYLLICLGIFLFYLLDYTENNKFEVQYTLNKNTSLLEDMERIKNDDNLNPEITIGIELKDNNHQNLSDNFLIISYIRNMEGYTRRSTGSQTFEEKICDVDVEIYYLCHNETDCSLREEHKRESYLLYFIYTDFFLDHQNKTLPIYTRDNWYSLLELEFSFYNKMKRNLEWQVIKYVEKGGLFSSGKEYYGGSVKSKDVYIYDQPRPKMKRKLDDGSYLFYEFLYRITVDSDYEFYDEYIRTEVPWLNIFSNSFSLIMSIFSGFKIVFDFIYAKNFNNYKIIQSILAKNEKLNSKEKKSFELNSDFIKSEQEINYQNDKKDIINIKEGNEIKENLIENNYNEYDNNNNKQEDSLELPKLHLYDFILNNFYLSKRCQYKKQNIISTSNEILSKYFSVEKILYNQIKFENLMKDYRWNDPKLKSIQNNELITKLKNFVINS